MKIKSIFFVFLSINLFSQNSFVKERYKLDSLKKEREKMILKIQQEQERLRIINDEIMVLEEKLKLIDKDYEKEKMYLIVRTGSGGAILREQPEHTSKEIIKIPPNTSIKIFKENKDLFIKAEYNEKRGYVHYSTLEINDELDAFVKEERLDVPYSKAETKIILSVNTNDPRYQKLKKLYGHEIAVRLMNSELWEGMSTGMVIESIGKPKKKENIDEQTGIKEIWEYDGLTLIFKNGILIKIMENKKN